MGFKKTDNSLYLGAKRIDFSNARTLRRTSTEAEQLLWNKLRNKKLNGFKFRRQHPIAGYIADFYCHEARLIIEIDGGIHDLPDHQEYDVGRTHSLDNQGIRLIRFRNNEIIENLENVLKQIATYLKG
jgi:very-short-patch-repair endonuclease